MSYRSDFEVAFLFHPVVRGPGSLVKDGSGLYRNKEVEAAYQGYEMARKGDHEHLKRYAPDRSIPIGLVNEINDRLRKMNKRRLDAETIRAVLICVGDSPC